MRRASIVILFSLALLAFVVARSAVIVDESEFVLVAEFGRPVATYGERPGEAGLHWQRPWQSARGVDRRLRVFDPPAGFVAQAGEPQQGDAVVADIAGL